MQVSNQNYGYIKIETSIVINAISLKLVITATLFLLLSLSILPSIGAKINNPSKVDIPSDSISKNSTVSIPVLENPYINYTESDKSSPPQPMVINGTHTLATTYVGNGALNGIEVTDAGTAYLVSKGNNSVYTFGKGVLASKDGDGTLNYTFRAVGHYHQDGKLYDIGIIFGPNPTGSLTFLSNTVGIYKDWFDKLGNGMIKMWFWKG